MSTTEKAGALEVRKPGEIATVQEKAAALEQVFVNAGIRIQRPDTDDDGEAALDIALRIAEAETMDQVLEPSQTVSGKDLIGFVLSNVAELVFRPSSFKGGVGAYLQFTADITDRASGETRRETVSIGALNVMTQLAKAAVFGELAGPFEIYESAPTAKGYTALWLRRAQ